MIILIILKKTYIRTKLLENILEIKLQEIALDFKNIF